MNENKQATNVTTKTGPGGLRPWDTDTSWANTRPKSAPRCRPTPLTIGLRSVVFARSERIYYKTHSLLEYKTHSREQVAHARHEREEEAESPLHPVRLHRAWRGTVDVAVEYTLGIVST